jgi:hypothetical protein
MSKKQRYKGFFLGVVFLLGLLLVTAAFLSRKEPPVFAQENPEALPASFRDLKCDLPIPTGRAIEEASFFLNDVFQQYQDALFYAQSARDTIQEIVSALSENPDQVCDFSVCRPRIDDLGPPLELKVDYIFGKKTLVGIHFPICAAKECLGNPCPDLTKLRDVVVSYKNAIDGSHEIVKRLFDEKVMVASKDIRKPSEPLDTLLRKPEVIRRYLLSAREWLHAIPGERASTTIGGIRTRSCSFSEKERELAQAGEIGRRFPLNCTQALQNGLYWPRPWSEYCENECKEGRLTDECRTCLAKDENNKPTSSSLAKINYKLYNICSTACSGNELTSECVDCICTTPEGERLTEDECAAFLCGGSLYNQVCCYESLIQ